METLLASDKQISIHSPLTEDMAWLFPGLEADSALHTSRHGSKLARAPKSR